MAALTPAAAAVVEEVVAAVAVVEAVEAAVEVVSSAGGTRSGELSD